MGRVKAWQREGRPDHSGRSPRQAEGLRRRRREQSPCPVTMEGELGGGSYLYVCDRAAHAGTAHHDPHMGPWQDTGADFMSVSEAVGIASEALRLLVRLAEQPGNRILILDRARELHARLGLPDPYPSTVPYWY